MAALDEPKSTTFDNGEPYLGLILSNRRVREVNRRMSSWPALGTGMHHMKLMPNDLGWIGNDRITGSEHSGSTYNVPTPRITWGLCLKWLLGRQPLTYDVGEPTLSVEL
ncbi:hypothetical protein PIB30_008045 [Stylosanthes scabra]|uniref:Uncharacterized protein n=1 Tax=Stylosanthes scabra TaxID=79078 RepID=A0ABU6W2T3_9FABA|nr:hypothetical protein [Stylosanthes scabra]